MSDLVAQVDQVSYRHWLDDLLYTHLGDDRGYGPEHDLARTNIHDQFVGFGLDTSLHPFLYGGNTYYNVVGVHTGRVRPQQVYVLGAHYDSVNNPGADDNASGVAAVMEAARIMAAYDFQATVVFIAFDREEQGLYGSSAYAAAHASDDIRGMVSLDMVAYNPDGPNANKARIYGRSASNPVKQALAGACVQYGGLAATQLGQLDASDHAPFERRGFQACLLIEHEVWNNPHYHKATDAVETPSYISYSYAAAMTRSALGYCASAAGVLTGGDADLNGAVDVLDLGVLSSHYGQPGGMTWTDGDFTGDGAVDYADLGVLATNYQAAGAPGVPEPAGAVLMGLSALALLSRRPPH